MKKLLHVLLSCLFARDVFSYQKLLSIHQSEAQKIAGTQLINKSLLYTLPYRGYVRDVMWSVKFRNNKQAAHLFGLLLYETLPDHLVRWEQFQSFVDPLLLIVPSSAKTTRIRGYNQNDIIIKSFINHGGGSFVQYLPGALKKIKNIPKQSRTKSKQERLNNPYGAFAVANAHLPALKNRNIILFDDVLTTGATTQEITHILKQAGASQIKVVVIAH